ncbi:MAG: hypothetical protein K5894_09365 [Lachnospiraceae bacterium]|nr:hypothetical protein [Lachnospiraceae bacterium]
MIGREFRKTLAALLSAAMVASMMVTPVMAAEASSAVESVETESTSTEEASTEEASTEEASTEEASTEEASTEETSTEEASTEETLTEASSTESNEDETSESVSSDESSDEETTESVSSDDTSETVSSDDTDSSDDETVSEDEVVSSSSDSDEVDTQSTNSRVRGYSLSLNTYFYTYTGSYIRPAVTLTYAGEEVASISAGTSSGTVSDNGWYFYYENNKKKGTAAVIAYKGSEVVTQTFKIMASSKLKLSKTKVFGVEQRESDDSTSQNDAALYYYDADTAHYYPLTEGVDYTKSITTVSSKKGRVTFTGTGSWSGTKKSNFKINTSSKKLFADPTNITVSMTYVYNSNTYSLDNLEDVEYTGSSIKPDVTLTTADGTVLTSGTDYKVKYKNNKKPGIATITITLKGSSMKSTYTGKIVKYFRINPINLTPKYEYYVETSGTLLRHTNSGGNAYILDYDGDTDYYYTYTGSQVIPKLRVVYDGTTWSRSNTEKRCVTYSINATSKRTKTKINPPTAYVFGKGLYGGYAGSVTFTIKTSGDDS